MSVHYNWYQSSTVFGGRNLAGGRPVDTFEFDEDLELARAPVRQQIWRHSQSNRKTEINLSMVELKETFAQMNKAANDILVELRQFRELFSAKSHNLCGKFVSQSEITTEAKCDGKDSHQVVEERDDVEGVERKHTNIEVEGVQFTKTLQELAEKVVDLNEVVAGEEFSAGKDSSANEDDCHSDGEGGGKGYAQEKWWCVGRPPRRKEEERGSDFVGCGSGGGPGNFTGGWWSGGDWRWTSREAMSERREEERESRSRVKTYLVDYSTEVQGMLGNDEKSSGEPTEGHGNQTSIERGMGLVEEPKAIEREKGMVRDDPFEKEENGDRAADGNRNPASLEDGSHASLGEAFGNEDVEDCAWAAVLSRALQLKKVLNLKV